VKDDAELNRVLLNSALDEAALHVNASAPSLQGPGLESLAQRYMEVQAIIRRWAKRYDESLLEQLVYLPEVPIESFDRLDWLRDWCRSLETRLNERDGAAREFRVEVQTGQDNAPQRLLVHRMQHGLSIDKHIQREFFESAEYRRIAELGRTLTGLIGEGAYVAKGDAREEVASFKQAMNWLLAEARKGQTIQRYKGLGEMNPEQLWDTTINPETRRLMQVKIEDAVAADDIFTTLMGDQVEPRREFIEKNAPAVANLDI
jgi:DNA gyrase subunit B